MVPYALAYAWFMMMRDEVSAGDELRMTESGMMAGLAYR